LDDGKEQDNGLPSAFASLLSFSGTSAKLHTQAMADAEQMFQPKEEERSSEPGNGLQKELGNESSLALTELGVSDESRIDSKGGRSEGVAKSADAPPVAKDTFPDTNGVSANVLLHVANEPTQAARWRARIASPMQEKHGGSAMPQNAAELLPSVANAGGASLLSARLSPTPAMQVAEVLKSATSEIGRSTSLVGAVTNAHPVRSQSASSPKSDGAQTPLRNGNPSAQQPPETEGPRFDELVKSLRMQMGTKQSSARLRLQPPELGHLRVDVKLLGDRVRIDVQTETDAARDLLSRRGEQLKAGLENKGIRLERLEVILNNSALSTAAPGGARFIEPAPVPSGRSAGAQPPRGTRRHEHDSLAGRRMGRLETLAAVDERLDING
jgi:flagellar hook-length control protein FliK